MIDLRSDTVTRPTTAMREAMFQAAVGDDVFVDDPTILALEEKAAAMFGKEAALFCASGTMTNQIAIKVHTQPGQEVICAEDSHIYKYEGGGMSFNSGVQARLLKADRGLLKASDILAAINPEDVHFPRTTLVGLENTHNRGGGSVYSLSQIRDIKAVCDSNQLPLHLDGARIFNALVASGTSALDMGSCFDSLSVCLSKGLGCPVGSLLLGSKKFIYESRRIRKVLGGGWRQAGYLAAAGIYALDHHVERLKEDHRKAAETAALLKSCSWMEGMLPQETNIIIFHTEQAEALINYLGAHGIKASRTGPHSIRFVFHLDISDEMVETLHTTLKKF